MAGAADRVHRSFASLQDDGYFLSGGAAGGSQAQQAKIKSVTGVSSLGWRPRVPLFRKERGRMGHPLLFVI